MTPAAMDSYAPAHEKARDMSQSAVKNKLLAKLSFADF